MLDSLIKAHPRGNKKPHRTKEWITMLATVAAYPNVDMMVFYVVAIAIFALTLYRYHRKQA
jgi:hypothetical protein